MQFILKIILMGINKVAQRSKVGFFVSKYFSQRDFAPNYFSGTNSGSSMSNIRVIGELAGYDKSIQDTDVGLLGGISTAVGSLTISGQGNLAFTIGTNGSISFDNYVVTNIVFDNLTHTIAASTTPTTDNGAGVIVLSGSGGTADTVTTAGGQGGTSIFLSGVGGAANTGTGAGGNGGDVSINAANGGPGTATGIAGIGGNVFVFAGNAGTNNGAGGNIGGSVYIDTGVGTGVGGSGNIFIGNAVASAMTIGNGNIGVAANGIWIFNNVIQGTIVDAQNTVSANVYTCPSGAAINQLVYINGADSVDLADNTSAGSAFPAIGFIAAKPTSTTCIVTWVGELGGFTGLVPGTVYFLGNSGAYTTAGSLPSPAVNQRVGVARNTTTMYLGFSHDYDIV
jgi:hypothetical protein